MARQKGQGSIYQKIKGGTYYLQYTINGRKKRLSLKVTHLKDKKLDGKVISGAESKAKEILDSIQTARTKQDVVNFVAEQRSIIKKSRVHFEDIWIEFKKRYKKPVSPGTMQNYPLNSVINLNIQCPIMMPPTKVFGSISCNN